MRIMHNLTVGVVLVGARKGGECFQLVSVIITEVQAVYKFSCFFLGGVGILMSHAIHLFILSCTPLCVCRGVFELIRIL